MPGIFSRTQRAFPAAVLLTVLLALLPARWLGWTAVPADVVAVPLQPLADGGVRVARWLRPADRRLARSSEALRERTAELEATRALLYAARLRIEGLKEEVAALQEARRYQPHLQMNPIFARVTGTPPARGQGPVRVNAGRRHGVVPGAVAVYRGGHLLGRVAADVSRLNAAVIPVTDPSIGLLEAFVVPQGAPAAPLEDAPRIQLSPDGAGALSGEIDRSAPVSAGDLVRIADPSWPRSAQGRIVGRVVGVEPTDLQPLLKTVTVEPRYHAQRVSAMTLIVERIEDSRASLTP